MARLGPEIMEDDEECDVASFFFEVCGLEYSDFIGNKKILTREIWEANLEKILQIVKERASRRATYFVFGYITLLTGSRLPAHIRPVILDVAKWEHEKNSWLDKEFAIERKFYLDDFRQKIHDHRSGRPTRLIYLKNGSEDITHGVIGINKFWEHIISGEISSKIHLNLDSSNLFEIPEPVFDLDHLKSLSLERNNIMEVPSEIENLTSLEDLDISWNSLTTLPTSIGNLASLKSLSCDHNKITTLPESLGKAVTLKELYLRGNKIISLPESLYNLNSLKYLDLGDNEITSYPDTIKKLSHIKHLFLSNSIHIQ